MSPVGPLTGNFRGTYQSRRFRITESLGRLAGCRGPVEQQTDPERAERSPKSVRMSPHAVATDRLDGRAYLGSIGLFPSPGRDTPLKPGPYLQFDRRS